MATVLTAAEKLKVDYDLGALLLGEPGRNAVGGFCVRERAKASPDFATLSTEIQAELAIILTALYNQTAPTILP